MTASRASLLSIILILAPTLSSGFVAPSTTTQSITSSSLSATSRRNFFEQSISTATTTAAILLSTTTSLPLPASAKAKEPPPPITRKSVTEAFDAIRYELNDPSGVVASLTNLIDNGSFEDIIAYTREQDAYFRRAKLGTARKLLTDKELKDGAVLKSNAVTWDLIGINRSSRPGKEDKEVQAKYLEDLKKDIGIFLELEETIVVEDE